MAENIHPNALYDGPMHATTPDASAATVATNNERARCAQLVVNFFLDAGAEETEAMTHPLVAAILRPPKDEVEQAQQVRS